MLEAFAWAFGISAVTLLVVSAIYGLFWGPEPKNYWNEWQKDQLRSEAGRVQRRQALGCSYCGQPKGACGCGAQRYQ